MKNLSFIAFLLAALLCFAGCTANEPDTDDKDEEIEENNKEKDEGEKKEDEDKDAEDDEAKTETYILNAYNSDFDGKAELTMNSDGTFAIKGSYPQTITSEDFDYSGIKSDDVTYDCIFEYRGEWIEKDGKIVCRGSNRFTTVDVEDNYKGVVKEFIRNNSDEDDEAVKKAIEMIETGKLVSADDSFSYVYEFEIEKTEDGYQLTAGRDYEFEDPTDLWASYEYEDGEIYTSTYYYAFGGIHYIHYYENGKIDHTDYYDVDGNYTDTSYPDENGEY